MPVAKCRHIHPIRAGMPGTGLGVDQCSGSNQVLKIPGSVGERQAVVGRGPAIQMEDLLGAATMGAGASQRDGAVHGGRWMARLAEVVMEAGADGAVEYTIGDRGEATLSTPAKVFIDGLSMREISVPPVIVPHGWGQTIGYADVSLPIIVRIHLPLELK